MRDSDPVPGFFFLLEGQLQPDPRAVVGSDVVPVSPGTLALSKPGHQPAHNLILRLVVPSSHRNSPTFLDRAKIISMHISPYRIYVNFGF